ncbi:DUF732 domain-containing protein [Streptomyces sp. NPDC055722]
MRRTLAATAAVLAGLVLAGCSRAPSDTDKKYAAVVAAADPQDFGAIDNDQMARTLGSEGPDLCNQLKKGTYADALAYAELGFNDRESRVLVAAAVPWYCPDQKDKLPKG